MTRFLFAIIVVCAVFFLPAWIALALAVALMFWFPFYVEGIAAALLIDILYSGTGIFGGFYFLGTALAIFAFALAMFLRTRLHFYYRHDTTSL